MCYDEIRSKEVTTRKRHECCWCGTPVEPGERAQSRAYRLDGDLRSDYMHPECNTASESVAATERTCIEWSPGDYPRGSTEPY